MIDRAGLLQSSLWHEGLEGAIVAMPQHVYYFTGHKHGPWGTGHKPIHVWGFPFFVLGPRSRVLVAAGSREMLSSELRPGVEAIGYGADSIKGIVDERSTAREALIQAVAAAGLKSGASAVLRL